MLVTLLGMVTLVSPAHVQNAESPMLVTPFGIVTLVRLEQNANAWFPRLMTLFTRGRFRTEDQNPISRVLHRLYAPIIDWVLRWPKTTLAINIVALVITVPMIMHTGSEFMPPLDEGSLLFMPVTLPSASITEVNRIMQEQDAIIRSVPEVEDDMPAARGISHPLAPRVNDQGACDAGD